MQDHPAVQLTQQLVRMRTTPDQGQRSVAELLADQLDSAGFDVAVHPVPGNSSNVVARLGPPDVPSLCLSGHLDTVPVVEEDWTADPFAATISDGRLWGRGSSDMKSGAAAIVEAATSYARANPKDPTPLSLVLTAEEELGCLGAARLADDESALPLVDALVIAEPSSNRPLLGHRGAVWLDLVAHGRSCHASTPHLGENAIDKLVRAIQLVHAWAEEHPDDHPVLGSRTLSVGRVEGGVLRNVVPDRATAQLDFRISDAAEVEGLPTALRQELADLADVEEVVTLSPVFCPQTDPFVRQTLDLAGQSLDGVPDEEKAARFITDACVLTPALGSPPTVIWGPGSADLAHVVDEWCSVAEIADATRMYADLIERRAHDRRTGHGDPAPSPTA